MTTLAPPELVRTADEWEALADYPSAVFSGIVGDLAHKLRGGYHISIEDQPSDNYSVVRVDDKAPPGGWRRDYASAMDMNLNLADMKKCHLRVRSVWQNRATDSRAKYFNAWNGWDGEGSPGRYSFVTGSVEEASEDHKWHMHVEAKRKYANDPMMRKAWISIVKGETEEQFLGEDEAMAFIENQAQFNAAMVAFYRATISGQIESANADGSIKSLIGDVVAHEGIPRDDRAATPELPRWPWWQVASNTRQLALDIKAAVAALTTLVNSGFVSEVSRDAQEAARDAAMTALMNQMLTLLSDGTAIALTDEQFNTLLSEITQKVAEVGADAAGRVEAKIRQVAEALDNAGEALATAADETPTQ